MQKDLNALSEMRFIITGAGKHAVKTGSMVLKLF
jgi:hypothetical protein